VGSRGVESLASKGFEWLTASPPPTHNFDEIPTITQMPHDYRTHEQAG